MLNRAIVRGDRPYAPTSLEAFEILAEAPDAVRRLKRAGFLAIVVTNQKDVGRGIVTEALRKRMHDRLLAAMPLDDIVVCTSVNGGWRYKPGPGMLIEAARRWGIDLAESVMIGDRWRDVGAGRRAGCRTVFIDRGYQETQAIDADAVARDLAEAADIVLSGRRAFAGAAAP
ncbi:MAG TPA: HAD-IIIA family hydrolase [Hyphomicrobiales bacterium]|nr:HAD-IIIA family hydrolase [Hyphomicrobiales bacterium]